MNRRNTAKILLLLFAFTLAACGKPQSSIPAGGGLLEAYSFDGHLFIVFNRGGILHHPGCPCLSAKVTKL